MRLPIAIAAIALLFTSSFVAAQKTAPPGLSMEVDGRKIDLVLPGGECALDAKQPSDKRALDTVGQIVGRGGNVLHLISADCKHLVDWRGGKVPQLQEYAQVQTRAAGDADYAGREPEVIASICAALKTQGGAISSAAESTVKGALEKGSERLKLEQMVFLGPLGQDAHGCYAGLLIKLQGPSGVSRTQLCIYAHVVLQGRIVFLYRYSDQIDAAAAERMLKERMAAAKAHVEANTGHGRRL